MRENRRIETLVRVVETERIPSRTVRGHIGHPPAFFEPRTGEPFFNQSRRLARGGDESGTPYWELGRRLESNLGVITTTLTPNDQNGQT